MNTGGGEEEFRPGFDEKRATRTFAALVIARGEPTIKVMQKRVLTFFVVLISIAALVRSTPLFEAPSPRLVPSIEAGRIQVTLHNDGPGVLSYRSVGNEHGGDLSPDLVVVNTSGVQIYPPYGDGMGTVRSWGKLKAGESIDQLFPQLLKASGDGDKLFAEIVIWVRGQEETLRSEPFSRPPAPEPGPEKHSEASSSLEVLGSNGR